MSAVLKGWIMGLVGASFVTAIVLSFSPEGKAKKVLAVVCGFVMIIALIKPFDKFDYTGFTLNLAKLRASAGNFTEPLNETNNMLTQTIIEERYTAYISDKGANIGIGYLAPSVKAALSEDGIWYIDSLYIETDADEAQKDKLEYEIELNLGINPKNITWEPVSRRNTDE